MEDKSLLKNCTSEDIFDALADEYVYNVKV